MQNTHKKLEMGFISWTNYSQS